MHGFPNFTALVLVAAGFLASPAAHATRIAQFNAAGQNIIGQSNGASSSMLMTGSVQKSSCQITVVNNSDQSQTITYYIELKVNGVQTYTTTASATLAASTVYTGTNCSSINSCTFPTGGNEEFTTISISNGMGGKTQQVSCDGWIKVDDTTTGSPGFVTASGSLSTYMETQPLAADAGAKNSDGSRTTLATTAPSNTPIIIMEGRPF